MKCVKDTVHFMENLDSSKMKKVKPKQMILFDMLVERMFGSDM